MTRVLVTGGTGFLGRFVVAALLRDGHEVTVFDLRPNRDVLDEIEPGLSNRISCVEGDITDGSVRDAAKGCDAIIHLAGVMTVECARDPVRGAQINVIGSLHVFEAARIHGIDRIAYVSSAGVFGPDDEVHPYPMTHYGAQKLAIEGAARAYLLDHGIPCIGFRPYIVYGPGQSSGIAAGPSIACDAAFRGEPATIRFSGRAGFVLVTDVAEIMVRAISSPVEGADAYTLCGETAEMDEFVQALKREIPDADITIEGTPLRIPGDLASSTLPPHLAALPVTGVREGIAATLRFYRYRQTGPV